MHVQFPAPGTFKFSANTMYIVTLIFTSCVHNHLASRIDMNEK